MSQEVKRNTPVFFCHICRVPSITMNTNNLDTQQQLVNPLTCILNYNRTIESNGQVLKSENEHLKQIYSSILWSRAFYYSLLITGVLRAAAVALTLKCKGCNVTRLSRECVESYVVRVTNDHFNKQTQPEYILSSCYCFLFAVVSIMDNATIPHRCSR